MLFDSRLGQHDLDSPASLLGWLQMWPVQLSLHGGSRPSPTRPCGAEERGSGRLSTNVRWADETTRCLLNQSRGSGRGPGAGGRVQPLANLTAEKEESMKGRCGSRSKRKTWCAANADVRCRPRLPPGVPLRLLFPRVQ